MHVQQLEEGVQRKSSYRLFQFGVTSFGFTLLARKNRPGVRPHSSCSAGRLPLGRRWTGGPTRASDINASRVTPTPETQSAELWPMTNNAAVSGYAALTTDLKLSAYG